MNKTVYLMFGPQGSGKSTQGERLAEYLNIPYFDAGAALRELAQSGTPVGNDVAQRMKAGRLVSNETLRDLFAAFIDQHDCSRGLVTDGFPRNEVQIELLEELSKQHHWQILGVNIEISDDTARRRLASRKILVDGQLVSRDDDQPEIVSKRLETFRRETAPIISWLKSRGEILTIDGEPSIDEVTETVKAAVTVHGQG